MLQIAASLSVELDGQPCFEVRTEEDRWMISFSSPGAFRRALKHLRHLTAGISGLTLTEFIHDAVHPSTVWLRVGQEVIGEVVPGQPTSRLARIAGLHIPGLRLRIGGLMRALLSRD